jgi:hypothetical protein
MPDSNAELAAATAAQRLRRALQELASREGTGVPTATALCELAAVSRNALYRYHTDVLHELHKLQHQQHHPPAEADKALQRLRNENEELHCHMSKLAALVDHYFSAWQEASSMLQRRERELSELRRGVRPKVIELRE